MWFLWKERSAAISVSPHFPQNNLGWISGFESGKKNPQFLDATWMFLSLDATFNIWFSLFLTTSSNHFRKYLQLVNNHTSYIGKCQIVCLAQCLLLFFLLVWPRCHSLTTRTLWEARTACSVNKDTLEKLRGFILQAGDSPEHNTLNTKTRPLVSCHFNLSFSKPQTYRG